MKKRLVKINKIIATALGLGYFPKAPGTMGALGGVLTGSIVIFWTNSPNLILSLLITFFFFLGVFSSFKLEPMWGKDPSRIVIDEVVGMWIAILFIPKQWIAIFLAFCLFRFFDIFKPLYIRKFENLKGGWGVMTDDVVAGIYANIVIQISNVVLIYFYK